MDGHLTWCDGSEYRSSLHEQSWFCSLVSVQSKCAVGRLVPLEQTNSQSEGSSIAQKTRNISQSTHTATISVLVDQQHILVPHCSQSSKALPAALFHVRCQNCCQHTHTNTHACCCSMTKQRIACRSDFQVLLDEIICQEGDCILRSLLCPCQPDPLVQTSPSLVLCYGGKCSPRATLHCANHHSSPTFQKHIQPCK